MLCWIAGIPKLYEIPSQNSLLNHKEATLSISYIFQTRRQQEKALAEAGGCAPERQLSADLVEARVRESGASRRAEMAERDRQRAEQSVREAHDRLQEMEAALGENSAALHAAVEGEKRLRHRLEVGPRRCLVGLTIRLLLTGCY